VPTQAELLDYESARAFIKLSTEIMGGLKTIYGDDKLFDLFRVLITRYKTSQAAVVKDILEVFGPYCLPEPMVDSAAVSRQMGEFTTLYEADPRAAGRVALKRARAAANDVNRLIENVLVDIFKQRRAQRARAAKQVA
jgi:cellulose biosynthesis protein BcsQ